jgi:hypothetical protein
MFETIATGVSLALIMPPLVREWRMYSHIPATYWDTHCVPEDTTQADLAEWNGYDD